MFKRHRGSSQNVTKYLQQDLSIHHPRRAIVPRTAWSRAARPGTLHTTVHSSFLKVTSMPGLYIRAPEVSLRIFTAPRPTVFLARVHDVARFLQLNKSRQSYSCPPPQTCLPSNRWSRVGGASRRPRPWPSCRPSSPCDQPKVSSDPRTCSSPEPV